MLPGFGVARNTTDPTRASTRQPPATLLPRFRITAVWWGLGCLSLAPGTVPNNQGPVGSFPYHSTRTIKLAIPSVWHCWPIPGNDEFAGTCQLRRITPLATPPVGGHRHTL